MRFGKMWCEHGEFVVVAVPSLAEKASGWFQNVIVLATTGDPDRDSKIALKTIGARVGFVHWQPDV